MKIKTLLLCIVTLAAIFSLACNRTSSAGNKQGSNVKVAQAKNSTKAESKVARIVFVGQKQACDCTRNRIEATWNTLKNALKAKPELPVKRIQRDVDVEEMKKMARLKPLMVAPGIYFIDKQDGLVELLQGEVSKEQMEKVIL